MTATAQYKVLMHSDLVDQFDHCFSPFDGISAIDDLFLGLPQVHSSRKGKRREGRTVPKTLKTYRARLNWCGMVVLYVEVRDELHVLDFGFIEGSPAADAGQENGVILPRIHDPARSEP
ncbi:MAG TPA: hypothetical protein VGN12_19560 [Pirellulales bacterium]|jgi:hypothetical protein